MLPKVTFTLNQYKRLLLGLLVMVTALVLTAAHYTSLEINQTTSLPYTAFLVFKSPEKQVTYGDFVRFNPPTNRKVSVTKKLVGREGDVVIVEGEDVFIKHKVGTLKDVDSKGNPLTPIEAGVILPGYVFVEGEHERSFDSRYKELGLVRADEIRKAIALF